MPKIIKNGKEYSGVPTEVVTAWAPTADPVQVKEPLMGNTDISSIGDGTVTGSVEALNTGLAAANKAITGINERLTKNYYSSAGTYTIAVRSSTVYLFVIDRLNTTSTEWTGLYIVSPHNSSHIVPIKACSGVTLSLDGLRLNITTTIPYITVSMVRWRYD